jgi:uncharacterized protein
MRVDVSDILRDEAGASKSFAITGESPDLEDVELADSVSGNLKLLRTETGIIALGDISTSVLLECSRCLTNFKQPLKLKWEAIYSDTPTEDEYLIERSGQIQLDEPIRQEIIVGLPVKQLCQAECAGINSKKDL